MIGAGDMLDAGKVIPYIMRCQDISREEATKVYYELKRVENDRIPDVRVIIDKKLFEACHLEEGDWTAFNPY